MYVSAYQEIPLTFLLILTGLLTHNNTSNG
jgi:hypothetical protein